MREEAARLQVTPAPRARRRPLHFCARFGRHGVGLAAFLIGFAGGHTFLSFIG